MQFAGYSLVNVATGIEAMSWASSILPSYFVVPGTGDAVHCPVLGDVYGDYRLVERYVVGTPTMAGCACIGESVSYDGSTVIATLTYASTRQRSVIIADITAIESMQPRAVREMLLGKEGSIERLHKFELDIEKLRFELINS